MELDKIKNQTTWNDASASINANFQKLRSALEATQLASHDKTHTHSQEEASATWVVVHNLDKYPSVTVVDSAGTEVFGDVHYDSESQLTVTFTAAFSGKAYLN